MKLVVPIALSILATLVAIAATRIVAQVSGRAESPRAEPLAAAPAPESVTGA